VTSTHRCKGIALRVCVHRNIGCTQPQSTKDGERRISFRARGISERGWIAVQLLESQLH
jgi:hypothetical protein